MLSDLRLLQGSISSEMLEMSKSGIMMGKGSAGSMRSSTPPSSTETTKSSKSSLFTVDSLLSGGSSHHHQKERNLSSRSSTSSSSSHNGIMVHEYNDLSPPATPPSPAVLKPLPVPNSPMFPAYPFPYPGNLLMHGLPFAHHPMSTWSGLKFNNPLSESSSSKLLLFSILSLFSFSFPFLFNKFFLNMHIN